MACEHARAREVDADRDQHDDERERRHLDVDTGEEKAPHRLVEDPGAGDEQEQRSTWEYLKQALDEDRLS